MRRHEITSGKFQQPDDRWAAHATCACGYTLPTLRDLASSQEADDKNRRTCPNWRVPNRIANLFDGPD
jgi:hypothetical protein